VPIHRELVAQTPAAAPPAVPADVTPLYVVTYVEAKPVDRDEAASLLKPIATRAAERPETSAPWWCGASSGRDSSSWPRRGRTRRVGRAYGGFRNEGIREKLNALRNAPADDRFHNSLSVGPMELASGAVYGVTHVDVIPPQKDNAIVALKALGEASRSAAGNVRFEIVQQTNRPNTSPCSKCGARATPSTRTACRPHQREFRDKLAGMAGALYDERLYEFSTRGRTMKRIAISVALLSIPLAAGAQVWNLPTESQRCPSKWGAGDERGSGNHMKNPETVLRGARLIKTGEVIELGTSSAPACRSSERASSTCTPSAPS